MTPTKYGWEIVRLTILAAMLIVRLIVNRAIADIKNEHVSIQRME
jgi:hypothetical protein